jgi:hypothetical protein
MIVDRDLLDIPLGVECAWPGTLDAARPAAGPRQHRLTEAWRRLMAALQPSRRSNWSR